jgi:hypothetical protein
MMGANHALLAGEVAAALAMHFPNCELETNEEEGYTGRVLITRPSGIWAVEVHPVAVNDEGSDHGRTDDLSRTRGSGGD